MLQISKGCRRPKIGQDDRGFTLIELLVVIIILGVLSAVVVFAVRGTGDKGKASSVAIDERTIRTAEESFCANKGRYGSGQELVDGKFLSELPTYHEVNAQTTGGTCNGSKFSILRTAKADPYPAGRWDSIPPPNLFTEALVRLADGKVFAQGFDGDSFNPAAFVWDPSSGIWTPQDAPPYSGFPVGPGAILLANDPATPPNECSGSVNNCGKILLFGKYLFSPNVAVGAGQWQTIPNPGSGCSICNNADADSSSVQIKGTPAQCGTNCGRIGFFSTPGAPCGNGNLGVGPCNVFDFYSPADNSYISIPAASPTLFEGRSLQNIFKTRAAQLPDGRIIGIGRIDVGGSRTVFLDPVTLTFTGEGAVAPPEAVYGRGHAPQPGPVLPNGDLFFSEYRVAPPNSGLYTPQANGPGSWRTVPSSCPGRCFDLGSLPDGRVLAFQSFDVGDPFNNTNKTSVYNPASQTWSPTGDLNNSQSIVGDALLLDAAGGPCGTHCGKVLVAGYQSAELYTP